ncbi:MAG: efflux RND transporter periplasmic adaptor subunit [Capsulimonadaceae bacterium]
MSSENIQPESQRTEVNTTSGVTETEGSPAHGPNPFKLVSGMALCLTALLCVGIVPRMIARTEAKSTSKTSASSSRSVDVYAVQPAAPFDEVDLPGNVQAIDQTAIVARASGYVKRWLVDIGDHVTEGQTLAIIETPDLDQQLLQAQAQLSSAEADYVQAKANVVGLYAKLAEAKANLGRAQAGFEESKTDLERARVAVADSKEAVARQQAQIVRAQADLDLAKVTSERYNGMLADGAVDQESADQAAATYKSSQADMSALQAALRAAQEDVTASNDAVLSAASNVQAYASGVRSAGANVSSAESNIGSGNATVAAAAANVRQNQANVNRFAVLQSFQNVTAPFSGVITARNIDTGTLISASGSSGGGSNSGSGIAGSNSIGNAASGSLMGGSSGSGGGSELYSIARVDLMRVYVNVPQADEDAIRVGQTAAVTVSNLQGRVFHGTIVRTADALDPISRTLVTEVRLRNSDGSLRPGMFAQVHLSIPHPAGSVSILDSSLVTNAQGSQVEVVTPSDTIHYQPVLVGRDFGKTMEILTGLHPGQQIIASVDDGLKEGQAVHVANIAQSQASGG